MQHRLAFLPANHYICHSVSFSQIDNGLGALRILLEELGEWDNTVVMFFSDNGGLASHGSVNRPFRGGKGDYWEGGVHVPAFVSGGFVSAALKRNGVEPYRYGHLTHVTDIHATVLRLGGYYSSSAEEEEEGGSDEQLDGFDLWDAMVETQAAVRQAVVINLNSPNFASSGAVRWGKYKLLRNPEPMETVIYSRVQSKLVSEGLVVSEVRVVVVGASRGVRLRFCCLSWSLWLVSFLLRVTAVPLHTCVDRWVGSRMSSGARSRFI